MAPRTDLDSPVESEFAETPPAARLRCQECGSDRVIYPSRTIDPRWMFGYCVVCKKRRIADVVGPVR